MTSGRPNPPSYPASAIGAAGVTHQSIAAEQAGQSSARHWTWVPIRALAPRHRPKVCNHLLSLDANDRQLRFGYVASDEQLRKYADMLDFENDAVFGVFNRKLDLVAVAHLAHQAQAQQRSESELGVSVLAKSRGRGFGHRLFERAMLASRNRGVRRLFIHALSENTAMLKIARDFGAVVERHGGESEAWLELPPSTLASKLGELVEQQAADFDYRMKLQLRSSAKVETETAAEPHNVDRRCVDESI